MITQHWFDDNYEFDITSWAAEAEINFFRIAQLVGAEFKSGEDINDEELFELALLELITDYRAIIIENIKSKYADTSQIMSFIGEFYEPSAEANIVSDEYLEAYIDKLRYPWNFREFFEWIDDGMARRN